MYIGRVAVKTVLNC